MPRISTDNYDTVASWNGSQDLFIVEQPDGTKVATPAMVKQFMEAGDFTATGEIIDGRGNALKDMAKSVNVDAKIGDLSQTGLTGDSVAEQLSDASDQIVDATTWKNISSQCTVDTTYVAAFKAYTCGKMIYISLILKPGVTDQTNVVSGLPNILTGYGVLPMFYMNVIDITSGGVCAYTGTNIQYRGNATQGSAGTQYSGMFLFA